MMLKGMVAQWWVRAYLEAFPFDVGPRQDLVARDISRDPCLVEEWLGCDVARCMFTYLDGAGLFDAPR